MNPNLQQVSSVYFFVMLITLGLAILLIRYTVALRRYLKEFTRVSKKVSNKEFHTRFNTYVKGELGELSKNFNYMIQIMDSTIEEVEKVINKLRPYLNRDGGDIELIDFKDGIVYVKMLGACAGCSMLDETLKDGVEQILMEEVPGVLGVQNILEGTEY